MTIKTAQQKENLADAYAAAAVGASLHTADPGSTGAAVAVRAAIVWATGDAVDGVQVGTATLTVPAGTTVTHGGLWSAATTGGVFLDGGPLSLSFTGPGTYALTCTYTQS